MARKKKVLLWVLHRPDRSPSQRFRFEQYLDFLRSHGYTFHYRYLIRAEDDAVFYGNGNYLGKVLILLRSLWIRIWDLIRARNYDMVLVQRESFMIGSAYFEKVLAKKIPLLYDFDDAIWIPAVSEGNRKLSFLKNFDKPREIIKVAQLIFAGNSYLANYARQYNSNVWIVPTTVDTDRFSKDESRNKEKLCIGWTGTFSTLAHFETVLDALYIIQEKYRERVYFKLIGVPSYRNDRLGIQGVVWTSETEIEELSALDIGLMPLPTDAWTEGKCGLKGLTYMSLGMATIMSPVGVNKEIIRDGENGYLAASLEEWVEKMSLLIEDERLRFELGQEARKTVLEKYSVISQRNQYLSAFNQLTDGKI